jgi:hypothetical protein
MRITKLANARLETEPRPWGVVAHKKPTITRSKTLESGLKRSSPWLWIQNIYSPGAAVPGGIAHPTKQA